MYFSSMFPKDFNDILLNRFLIQNIEELDTLKVISIFLRKAEKLRSIFFYINAYLDVAPSGRNIIKLNQFLNIE